MIPLRTSVDLEGGVAELLVTPALYGVAKRKKIDLQADLDAGDVFALYTKVIYCAAIAAWEVAGVDGYKGEFPYKYEDFYTWAAMHPDRFNEKVAFVVKALTGKDVGEVVKKKAGRK